MCALSEGEDSLDNDLAMDSGRSSEFCVCSDVDRSLGLGWHAC